MSRLAAAACGSVLASCATTGNQVIKILDRDGAAGILQRGVSTKAEVNRTLGSAKVNKFDSGYEVWTYRYDTAASKLHSLIPIIGEFADGSTGHTRELIILFNPAGVLIRYRLYDGSVSAN